MCRGGENIPKRSSSPNIFRMGMAERNVMKKMSTPKSIARRPMGVLKEQNLNVMPSKAGSVYMHQTSAGRVVKVRVVLKVYNNGYDKYAVISQDKVLCKDCGYISLRNCSVTQTDPEDCSFQIIPRNGEGQKLTFSVSSHQDVDSWLEEFQTVCGLSSECLSPLKCCSLQDQFRSRSPCLPKDCLLPALEEEEGVEE